LIGGIGVAPVLSIVFDAAKRQADQRIILIHANTSDHDAPFASDFQQLSAENPNFSYVPTVDQPSDDWQGEVGHIDEAMIRRHVDNIDEPIYYLSGLAGMVKVMRSLLVEIGVDEDNIRTEEFDGY